MHLCSGRRCIFSAALTRPAAWPCPYDRRHLAGVAWRVSMYSMSYPRRVRPISWRPDTVRLNPGCHAQAGAAVPVPLFQQRNGTSP
jgi:hypothetical protein